MADFIETVEGAYILSSEIVEIKETGPDHCTISTRQGGVYKVECNGERLKNDIERKSSLVIAAQPGYSVAYLTGEMDEKGGWKKYKLPVIGWHFDPNGSVQGFPYDAMPVVAGSVPLSIGGTALVLPDGMVKTKYSELPMTGDEWIEAVKDFVKSLDLEGDYEAIEERYANNFVIEDDGASNDNRV
jgi:hypothetical protein